MVSIKRFIIGLAAALHTCIEMSLAECNNPENAFSADQIVKVTNHINFVKIGIIHFSARTLRPLRSLRLNHSDAIRKDIIGKLSASISKLSAVSRLIPDLCSAIANG